MPCLKFKEVNSKQINQVTLFSKYNIPILWIQSVCTMAFKIQKIMAVICFHRITAIRTIACDVAIFQNWSSIGRAAELGQGVGRLQGSTGDSGKNVWSHRRCAIAHINVKLVCFRWQRRILQHSVLHDHILVGIYGRVRVVGVVAWLVSTRLIGCFWGHRLLAFTA
jgi:hypothetical protein